MFGECHTHLFMNGENYRQAVEQHKGHIQEVDIRAKLEAYREHGVTFLRDGGDNLGVSKLAKSLAEKYDIDYRTPVFAIHKNGHYGRIVGRGFSDMKEYHERVLEAAREGCDFIKVMFSGIMDFGKAGTLTEAPIEKSEIQEMIHIAHEEGFAVMAHVNGPDAVLHAVEAGVDSVEHGNFVDEACLFAMAQRDVVWVPTYVTITNLIGSGRFDDAALEELKLRQGQMIKKGYELGVNLGLGSDSGAYRVLHVKGIFDEYEQFQRLIGAGSGLDARLQAAEDLIRKKFCRQS